MSNAVPEKHVVDAWLKAMACKLAVLLYPPAVLTGCVDHLQRSQADQRQ